MKGLSPTKKAPVIVIGMDNTGKTTLINHLARSVPKSKIIKIAGAKLERDTLVRTVEEHMKLIENPCDNLFIYDRFSPIDELVYGPVIRGSSKITQEEHLEYMWRLKQGGAIIIYCRPTNSQLMYGGRVFKSIYEREQMSGVTEFFWDLLKKWDEMYFNLNSMFEGKVFHYDYVKTPLLGGMNYEYYTR